MTAEKARWRERFRADRHARAPDAFAAASDQIASRLAVLLAEPSARGAVALFWPLPGEVDLRPLAHTLCQRGASVVLPAVVGHRQLAWRRFHDAGTLTVGRWGVREPGPDADEVAPEALSAVVVPGLAFGRDGSRLGFGGGFYDTALARTEAARLGVAVGSALVDAVPHQAHDARMDVVVTDGEVWRVP